MEQEVIIDYQTLLVNRIQDEKKIVKLWSQIEFRSEYSSLNLAEQMEFRWDYWLL